MKTLIKKFMTNKTDLSDLIANTKMAPAKTK